ASPVGGCEVDGSEARRLRCGRVGGRGALSGTEDAAAATTSRGRLEVDARASSASRGWSIESGTQEGVGTWPFCCDCWRRYCWSRGSSPRCWLYSRSWFPSCPIGSCSTDSSTIAWGALPFSPPSPG